MTTRMPQSHDKVLSPHSADSKPRFRKVGQILEAELGRVEAAISKGSFKIWGEVIELHSNSNSTRCQIRDKDLLKSIQVRLPANAGVKLGDYILVTGSLSATTNSANGSATLVVTGVVEKKSMSNRLRAINKTIKILETSYTPRPLPEERFGRVAVVTGHQSKAPADFRVALSRCKPLAVEIVHARLSDPVDIARAIESAALSDIDLLVVTRGGGDTIMLAVFDEPEVLTALAKASHQVPVILAVGHATDTLRASRFVTLSCTTPTAAGTRVRRLYYKNKSEVAQPATPKHLHSSNTDEARPQDAMARYGVCGGNSVGVLDWLDRGSSAIAGKQSLPRRFIAHPPAWLRQTGSTTAAQTPRSGFA